MKRKEMPETSLIAHLNKSDESKQRDYNAIIMAFQNIGSGIYTDVASFLKWDDANKVARRMKELRELGKLENTGLKKMTPRNRPAFIHQLCNVPTKTPIQLVDDMIAAATKLPVNGKLF